MLPGKATVPATKMREMPGHLPRIPRVQTDQAEQELPRRTIRQREDGNRGSEGQVTIMNQSKLLGESPQVTKRFLIRSCITGETLYCHNAESLSELMESAARNRVPLTKADLRNRNLEGANIAGIDLTDADLCYADVRNANMSRSDLSGAQLVGTKLSGTDLEAADLMGANLTGADLSGAKLHRANLANVELAGAILKDADLSYCNLDGCNLTGADFDGASLLGTNLLRASKDKVAEEKLERQEVLQRLVFSPAAAILLQVALMAIQVLGLMLAGPFQLFWFVGVTIVNAYLMCTRSWRWGLGLLWQTLFFALLWRGIRISLIGH